MFAECEENVLTFFREQREKINTKKMQENIYSKKKYMVSQF